MAALRARLLAAACAIGLAGCAVGIAPGAADAPHSVVVQNLSLSPAEGGPSVALADLRAGDIVLTADDGVASTGIRMLTLSPVSHAALYLGDGQVVEAVGAGVRARSVADLARQETAAVALRHPGMTDAHAAALRDFAQQHLGGPYNTMGIVLQTPYTLERKLCELPGVPLALRDACLRGLASVQLGLGPNDRFFCSQFVLQAYRYAGLPLTDADPRLANPRDLLHMREGDVPSVRTHQALHYLGRLAPPRNDAKARAAPVRQEPVHDLLRCCKR